MYTLEESIKIRDIIFKYNLYPDNIIAYVELFNNGSSFFWAKNLSKVEFINDINSEINYFLESIRNFDEFYKKYEKTIYSKFEPMPETLNDILNSEFYKRLNRTYIMNRKYNELIDVTDSENTLYYCECFLDDNIFSKISQIKGKYLIINKDINNLKKFNNNNNLLEDEFSFLFNYKNEKDNNLLF